MNVTLRRVISFVLVATFCVGVALISGHRSAPSASADGRIWGDVDCGGDIGPRDAQAILKNVLVQNALSQTQPCPAVGSQVTVDGVSQIWGDVDCGGDIGPRDAQAILKNVLVQNALSQTQPCPAVGDTVTLGAGSSPTPTPSPTATPTPTPVGQTPSPTPTATPTPTPTPVGQTPSPTPTATPTPTPTPVGQTPSPTPTVTATPTPTHTLTPTPTPTGSPTPTVSPTPAHIVTAISAGYDHTCALKDGGVWCWGLTGGSPSSVPVAVSGLGSGVSAISAGQLYTCALKDGGAWCWGTNDYGQLGNGTTTNSSVPVAVSGLGSGVSAISAGFGFDTCALTTAGAVWCWGYNVYGQLGNNSTTGSNVPVAVSGLGSGVSAISVGLDHTCALTTAGAVWCWGRNSYGDFGDGTTTDSSVPVAAVSGLGSGVSAISAGYRYTCALKDGGVWCWGWNGNGQFGNGTTTNSSVPVAVSGLGSGVSAISAGVFHTCALKDGGVWWWGYNSTGQLGDGTTTTTGCSCLATPVAVSGLGSGVSAISVGSQHTCALKDGGVWCWGYNLYGQLGNGTTTNSSVPVAVSAFGGP